MNGTRYLLGIDCGQTAVKVALFDSDGFEISSHSAPTGVGHGENGEATLDSESLFESICALIGKIPEEYRKNTVSVGVSGHGNGVYTVYKDGSSSAILSTDLRALPVIERWQRDKTGEKAMKITGCLPWAGQPAPILRYIKENDRKTFDSILAVMSCADWVNYKLTSVLSADVGSLSTSGLLNLFKKEKDGELYSLYGLEELNSLIPKMAKYGDKVGVITPEVAKKTGLPPSVVVGCGSFDVNACCKGSGMPSNGRYSVIAGTWSINSAFTDSPVINENLFSCNVFGDGERYINIESSPTSAVNLEEFLKLHNDLTPRDCDVLCQYAKETDADGLYMPYIFPLPNMPWLKGGFVGKAKDYNLPEKVKTLFEGVALGHRYHIERLKKSGLTFECARLTGGVSNSKIWTQIFADALGMKIETVKVKSSGALGAALCGGIAAGVTDGKNVASLNEVKTVYPNQNKVGYYDEKYKYFVAEINNQTNKRSL